MRNLSILSCILLIVYSNLYSFNTDNIDSVLEKYLEDLECTEEAIEKSKIIKKVILHLGKNNPEEEETYLTILHNLAIESKDPIIYSTYYAMLGNRYINKGSNLDSCLFWMNTAIAILDTNNIEHIKPLITNYNNKALAFQKRNMHNLCIEEYIKAIELYQKYKIQDSRVELILYVNISRMLIDAKRYNEAKMYIKASKKVSKKLSEETKKVSPFHELIAVLNAESQFHLKEYSNAKSEILQNVSLTKKTNSVRNRGKLLLGKIYLKQDSISIAERYLLFALEETKTSKISFLNTIMIKKCLAEKELKNNNFNQAAIYLQELLENHRSRQLEVDDSEIFELLAIALEKSGKHKESNIYLKKYLELYKEETNQEYNIKFEEHKIDLKNIEKQSQIEKLENDKRLQKSKLITLLLALVISLFVIFFIYYLYKKKNSLNDNLMYINEELRDAKNKALQASKAKENFLSTMSHEMRTPLNAIIGITNILIDENRSAIQSNYLQNLKFSGESLLQIINDVLDFSKIEAQKLDIINKELHLQSFLNKLVNSIKHGNKNEKVKVFEDQNLEQLGHLVNADEVRINQILTNLLGNAIKFTNEGKVILKTEIINISQENVSIKFSVKDTGIGIPEDKITQIFGSFTQVNNKLNRKHQGTGLGLGISKKLVELQGGKLNVESKVGVGSTFSFTLTLEKRGLINDKDHEDKGKSLYRSGIDGNKILLVEDNKLNQMVALKVLSKFNLEVDVADNGKIAIDLVEKNMYDLILMDIHMPIMDGISATRIIRSLSDINKNQVPIVALSADAYSSKVQEALEAGMDDYQSKPFKPDSLFEKIKLNINKNKSLGA